MLIGARDIIAQGGGGAKRCASRGVISSTCGRIRGDSPSLDDDRLRNFNRCPEGIVAWANLENSSGWDRIDTGL